MTVTLLQTQDRGIALYVGCRTTHTDAGTGGGNKYEESDMTGVYQIALLQCLRIRRSLLTSAASAIMACATIMRSRLPLGNRRLYAGTTRILVFRKRGVYKMSLASAS